MAVFGPYIAGALTGQLVVLLCGTAAVIIGLPLATRSQLPLLPVIGLWFAILVITVIASAWRPIDPNFYGTLSAVHSLWWLVMPQLVMIMSWYWTRYVPSARVMLALARVIAIAMSANSVLAIAQLSTGQVNLGGVLSSFWSTISAGQQSVAQMAAENGRYTGIFDEPAEAGAAYGIALLCIIYLVRRGARWQVADAGAVLVVAGGILCVSKVFLFAALPIAAWVAVTSSGTRLRIFAGAGAGALALLAADAAGLLPAWSTGSASLQTFLHPNGSFTTVYTAGRYGSGGSLESVAADVLRAAPWTGFGARGLYTAYDSQWLEILVLSGIFGVICLAASLIMLGWRWLRMRRTADPADSMLAGSVLVLAILASSGFPSLTSDRAGILIWLILGVYLNGRGGEPLPA
jgi:hypothetical protein